MNAENRKQFKELVKRGKAATKMWGSIMKKPTMKKLKKEIDSEDEKLKLNGRNETKRGFNTTLETHSKNASSIDGGMLEMATLRPYIEISSKSKVDAVMPKSSKTKDDD